MNKKTLTTIMGAVKETTAIFNPSERNAMRIIDWLMPQIDYEALRVSLTYYAEYLITNNINLVPYFDPVPGLFARFGELNKYEKPARYFGRKWWGYIERFMADPNKVLSYMVEKNPKLKEMLSTGHAQLFIRYYAKRLRDFFREWFFNFPRAHNGCGGLIKYGMIDQTLNLWGFYCRRCKFVIPEDKVELYTHRLRIPRQNKNA